MSNSETTLGGTYERLCCALACAYGAVHLYDYVRPNDGRLRLALDLVTQYLADERGTASITAPENQCHDAIWNAMWDVQRAAAGEASESLIDPTTGAVILLCRAVVGRMEGEEPSEYEIEAFQACWYFATAVEHAFNAANVLTIPDTVLTRQDIHALSQSFLLWGDYWNEVWAGNAGEQNERIGGGGAGHE